MRLAVAFDDQILRLFAQEPLEEIATILDPEAQSVALGPPIETPAANQTWAAQQRPSRAFASCFRSR